MDRGLRHQQIMNAVSRINASERPGLAGLRRRLLDQARLLNPTPQPAPEPEPMILQSNSSQRNVQEREQQDESVPVRQRLLTLPPREIVNLLPQEAQAQYDRLLEMRRSARFSRTDDLNWRLLSSSLDRAIRLYNQQQAAAGNNRGGKSSKKRRRSRSRRNKRRRRIRSRRSSNRRMKRSRIRRRRY